MAHATTTVRVSTHWTPLTVSMNSYWGGVCTIRCDPHMWTLSVESPEELLRLAKAMQAFAEEVLAESPQKVQGAKWSDLHPERDDAEDAATEEADTLPSLPLCGA